MKSGKNPTGAKSSGRKLVTRHTDLEVYNKAFDASMAIFRHSKTFPKEERYSLTDQIRRSSRSAGANLAEAWRQRRYEAAFESKLNDSKAEAAETQTWLQFAVECEYLDRDVARSLDAEYDSVLAMLVDMIRHSNQWTLK